MIYPSDKVYRDLLDITLEGDFTWQTGWRGMGLVRASAASHVAPRRQEARNVFV